MREQAEGVDVNTRRGGRPPTYNRRANIDFLRENFRDLPEWRRNRILSYMERMGEYYHKVARRNPGTFEEAYEPQPVKRTLIKKHAEQ